MKSLLRVILAVLIWTTFFRGENIKSATVHVPSEQPTIQAGIDSASEGDTVFVAQGTYTGEGNRDIDFGGKNIVVKSEIGPQRTIIDCEGLGRGFYFHSGEDTSSVVQGFTISGGLAEEGGGLYICNSGPRIVDNVIRFNAGGVVGWDGELYGGYGAAICLRKSTSVLVGNQISSNQFGWTGEGTGIYCDSSSLTITGNTICDNYQTCHSSYGGIVAKNSHIDFTGNVVSCNFSWDGGPVEFQNSNVEFTGNVVRDNFTLNGNGVVSCPGSQMVISNSVILANLTAWQPSGCNLSGIVEAWRQTEDRPGIKSVMALLDTVSVMADSDCPEKRETSSASTSLSSATVTNCISWGNSGPGMGIAEADELIVRYSVVSGGWSGEGNLDVDPLFVDPTADELVVCAESPCIDAGDPSMTDPDGTRSDIGLYWPRHPICNPGIVWHVATNGDDLTGDGSVVSPFRTIQKGIDESRSGDTVLVERGTYYETVNLYLESPVLTSRFIYTGDTADIDMTIICADSVSSCVESIANSPQCRLSGFTITRQQSTRYHRPGIACEGSGLSIVNNVITKTCGRGIAVRGASRPVIEANIIDSNRCAIAVDGRSQGIIRDNILTRNYFGHPPEAGITCENSNPVIEGNIIYDNGGGIYLYYTEPLAISGNVLWNNDYGVYVNGSDGVVLAGNTVVSNGVGISTSNTTEMTIQNSIISYQRVAGFRICYSDLHCNLDLSINNTDIFGNAGGDWIEYIEDQLSVNGNLFADPQFCDTVAGDYHLHASSPCAPQNTVNLKLIGALGVGCTVYDGPVWYVATDGSDTDGNGSPLKPFATIQTGVDAAAVGDTVLIAPGTYTGESNRDIDFGGKNIVVKSEDGPQETIIDCERLGRGFYFHSGEDTSAVVEGLTITNGYAQDGFVPPVMFAGLHRYGGAILCDSSGPTIRGNVIYGNRTWEYTGGIESGGVGDGGGIGCYRAQPHIVGNVVTDNYAPGPGDGIACYESTPTIVNSIIRDGMSTHATGVPDPIVRYCNVEGGWTGEGNIDQDAHFVAPSEYYFNACSESPCIDAGDPSVTDPDGSRSDIGLYYSEHPECLYGTRNIWHVYVSGSDINGNGSPESPFRTIQQGIRMATDRDTVLVYPGVYHENVGFAGSDVVLMSMNIRYDPSTIPLNTVISGVDWPGKPATVAIASGEGHGAVVQGFVIENGVPGVEISNASPTISDNLIRNNGQGISCSNTTAHIVRSVVSDNHAPCGTDGGGIACTDSANITALNCTIILNSVNRWLTEPEIDCADIGSAVYADESLPIFSHCIVAFNYVVSWAPVCCAVVGPVQLEHCNMYGNAGGDWFDCETLHVDSASNFSVNPLFCDSAAGDYHISSESLCCEENSRCGSLVGALGVGCSDRCCGVYNQGRTGNTDCGTDGKLTLADITRLIDFIYISKKPLCCERSGNTDGSDDGKISLSDITRLVDNVYISKEPSELCL